MVDRLVNSEANTRRIAFVERCFGSSSQPLAVPNRVLVGEGVLTKVCRKKAKPRQFFLFNDVLVYGNILISKKKYNKQHIIDLADVTLQSVEDGSVLPGLRNGWQIISPKKSFTVCAATATEKSEWMAHIQKCVTDLLAKRGKTQQTTENSPVWVPDQDSNKCQVCNKTEFTVLQRRHHCRKCGRLCCQACSSKKWLMPLQSSKPLRVCDTCYENLTADTNPSQQQQQPPAKTTQYSSDDSSSDEDEVDTQNNETNKPEQKDETEPTFYEDKNNSASNSDQ
ncbi:pleckstrin homology domain-containing family F member 2-like [Tubulanus polymorphus]|uniref:pleckstrin homology domain-containing family F member 2-like n=1 Tax=Tubulanus polymorphus TaxID=672921 RepID=UPI003DA61FD0